MILESSYESNIVGSNIFKKLREKEWVDVVCD